MRRFLCVQMGKGLAACDGGYTGDPFAQGVKDILGEHLGVQIAKRSGLLGRWQRENLSAGTIKNRLSHLRWWAEKIGKAGILPADNTQLGVPERRYVTNVSKARELETAALA